MDNSYKTSSVSPSFLALKPVQGLDIFSPYEYLMGIGQRAWADLVKDNEARTPDTSKYDETLRGKQGELLDGRYRQLSDDLYSTKKRMKDGIAKYSGFAKAYFASEEGSQDLSSLNDWYNNFNTAYREKKAYDMKYKDAEQRGILNNVFVGTDGKMMADESGNALTTAQVFNQWESQKGEWTPRDFGFRGMSDKTLDEHIKAAFDGLHTKEWTFTGKDMMGTGTVSKYLGQDKYKDMSDSEKYMAFFLSQSTKFWDNSESWAHAKKYFDAMVSSNPDMQAAMQSKWAGMNKETKALYEAKAADISKKSGEKQSGFANFFNDYLGNAAAKYYIHDAKSTGHEVSAMNLSDSQIAGRKKSTDDLGYLWNATNNLIPMKRAQLAVGVPAGDVTASHAWGVNPNKEYTQEELNAIVSKNKMDKAGQAMMPFSDLATDVKNKSWIGVAWGLSQVNPMNMTTGLVNKGLNAWLSSGGDDPEGIKSYFEPVKGKPGYFKAKEGFPMVSKEGNTVLRQLPIYTPHDDAQSFAAIQDVEGMVGKKLKDFGKQAVIADGRFTPIGKVGLSDKNEVGNAEVIEVGRTPYKSLKPSIINSASLIDAAIKDLGAVDGYGNPKLNNDSWTWYVPVKIKFKNIEDAEHFKARGTSKVIDKKFGTKGQEVTIEDANISQSSDYEIVDDGKGNKYATLWVDIPQEQPYLYTKDKARRDNMIQNEKELSMRTAAIQAAMDQQASNNKSASQVKFQSAAK
jgi:hypothetical protein